ncbi:MAG: carboxypeptidase regulatory-like domain-containing protein, partial [bacterium]
MSYRLASLFSMLAFAVSLQAQNLGNINGFVRKAATQEPLAGVTVRILGTERTAMTDSTGFYRFRGVETRAWNLEASSVGYRTLTKFDIQVTSGNTSEVNFELEEERQELQGVVIRANFPKPVGVVNSVQSLSINEIVRYPGANFDMAKVVQSFPGVSGSASFRNDIIIRGGAPNENVYYLDGVE